MLINVSNSGVSNEIGLNVLLSNISLDSLRTLVISQDPGGFGRASQQLRVTPSAISLQMKRLQEEIGVPIFRR